MTYCDLPCATKAATLFQNHEILDFPVDQQVNGRTHARYATANDDHSGIRQILVGDRQFWPIFIDVHMLQTMGRKEARIGGHCKL